MIQFCMVSGFLWMHLFKKLSEAEGGGGLIS